jgi:hypothetical protein
MANIFVRLDTTGFAKACDDLARISGKSFKEAVRAQTGAVLRALIKKTPPASKKKIAARAQKVSSLERGYLKNGDGSFLVNSEKKFPGRKWLRKPSEKTGKMTAYIDDPTRRWSNKTWNQYEESKARWTAKLSNFEKQLLSARGFAKKTWLKISEDLNLAATVKAPGYVKKASARTRRKYDNGSGMQKDAGDTFFTLLVNKYRWFGMIKFKRKFQRVLDDRKTAFEIEMAHGLFEDMTQRAKRYPGLFVLPPKQKKRKIPDPPEES